jgi:hypothetical protein
LTKQFGDIDGWHIEVYQQDDLALPWRADAFDPWWAMGNTAGGFDKENSLSQLAYKIGVDRKRLLAVFGL